MNWDDKSINGYLKGETFQVDRGDIKGSFTIKYVSVKCGNSVDIILDDDFSYKYYYRGDFEKVSNLARHNGVIRINKYIRRGITSILGDHFKLLGFGFQYYKSRTYTDFKIRKILYPKKDSRP
jgi:hypothetical protein